MKDRQTDRQTNRHTHIHTHKHTHTRKHTHLHTYRVQETFWENDGDNVVARSWPVDTATRAASFLDVTVREKLLVLQV